MFLSCCVRRPFDMPECGQGLLQVLPTTVEAKQHDRVPAYEDKPPFHHTKSQELSCGPTPQPQLTGQDSTIYCPLGIWGGGSGMSAMWWRGPWPGAPAPRGSAGPPRGEAWGAGLHFLCAQGDNH